MLTTADLAAAWKCDIRTAQRACKSKILPNVKRFRNSKKVYVYNIPDVIAFFPPSVWRELQNPPPYKTDAANEAYILTRSNVMSVRNIAERLQVSRRYIIDTYDRLFDEGKVSAISGYQDNVFGGKAGTDPDDRIDA